MQEGSFALDLQDCLQTVEQFLRLFSSPYSGLADELTSACSGLFIHEQVNEEPVDMFAFLSLDGRGALAHKLDLF